MDENFTRYDTARYLHTEEDIALYLDACLEEDPGDGSLIRTDLGVIARARGMSQLTGNESAGLRVLVGADRKLK